MRRASRDKVKRQLLDKLDTRYAFELPEGLVNQEFESIWRQVTREQQAADRTFADEGTTEEAARADYRKIAERRVRLGLLLAEVGSKADVKVSDEEMTQALIARARASSRARRRRSGSSIATTPGPRRTARADLRGEGRGPYSGPCEGRGAEGVARRSY